MLFQFGEVEEHACVIQKKTCALASGILNRRQQLMVFEVDRVLILLNFAQNQPCICPPDGIAIASPCNFRPVRPLCNGGSGRTVSHKNVPIMYPSLSLTIMKLNLYGGAIETETVSGLIDAS